MIAILQTVLLLVLTGSPDAQSAGQEVLTRTSEIHGRVTDKESGRPIPRAVVRILPVGSSSTLTATTDDEGQYRFTGLSAGSYSGIVDAGAYRATHVMGPLLSADGRRTITLQDGEVRKDFNVALVRALTMTVRVVDEWGEPLSGLAISVRSARTGRQVHGLWPRTTDDRGRLRLFKIPPGRDLVCAESGPFGFIPR